jgi:hypothetical protein
MQESTRFRPTSRIGNYSSIFTFTHSFQKPVQKILTKPQDIITIDGGPHILW